MIKLLLLFLIPFISFAQVPPDNTLPGNPDEFWTPVIELTDRPGLQRDLIFGSEVVYDAAVDKLFDDIAKLFTPIAEFRTVDELKDLYDRVWDANVNLPTYEHSVPYLTHNGTGWVQNQRRFHRFSGNEANASPSYDCGNSSSINAVSLSLSLARIQYSGDGIKVQPGGGITLSFYGWERISSTAFGGVVGFRDISGTIVTPNITRVGPRGSHNYGRFTIYNTGINTDERRCIIDWNFTGSGIHFTIEDAIF